MAPCAAAAAAQAVSNARRAEDIRRKAEEDLKESQSQQMDKPKGIKSVAEVLSLNFKKKQVIPGLEALDSSPAAVAVKGKERIYQSTALFCLRPGHEPRRSFIKLVESKPFDPLILITILANCGTMAWESPLDPCCTDKAAFIAVCEWVYLIIFTVEMFAKIIAYGFVWCGNDTAYLTDAWCKLDITVVTLAWLPILIPSFGNYSVIRSVRALRPLRALKRVPGMPVLVSSIMAAFPKMGNVAALCGFVFLVFGIVGVELFKGSLHHRCALPGLDASSSASAQVAFDTEVGCRPDGIDVCDPGTHCAYFERNPNFGITSFDSVALASIILLQVSLPLPSCYARPRACAGGWR